MATMIEEAFSRICRMKLPVCFDDVLVEIDPNTFRVPMVLDELAESKEPAPVGLCVVLGLEPGSSFRQAVQRYRESMAPPTPQPRPPSPRWVCTDCGRHKNPGGRRKDTHEKKKSRRPRLRLVEAAGGLS